MSGFMQEIDFAGIIMPNNWDEDGKIIEIALYTNTEEVYTVEYNNLIQELMSLLHKNVEVKGKIREHPDGKKSITVHNYIVLEKIVDDEKETN
jgi:hypothetical protein